MTSLKQPHSLDEPLEPLNFTVDPAVVERLHAARLARHATHQGATHPDVQARHEAVEELCSVALAELAALHAVPHVFGSHDGQIEATQVTTLRHEIGQLLVSVVDGSIDLDVLSLHTVHHLIGAHRQAQAMLAACKGSPREFDAIAALLRHVHAAANIG